MKYKRVTSLTVFEQKVDSYISPVSFQHNSISLFLICLLVHLPIALLILCLCFYLTLEIYRCYSSGFDGNKELFLLEVTGRNKFECREYLSMGAVLILRSLELNQNGKINVYI